VDCRINEKNAISRNRVMLDGVNSMVQRTEPILCRTKRHMHDIK